MTTANEAVRRTNWKPLVFLALAVLAVVITTPVGRILLGRHAVERHGAEAQQVRRCLEQQGAKQTWQQDDDPSVHCFVVETDKPPCSKLAIMIAQVWPSVVDECDYRELTSFRPANGDPDNVIDYLLRQFTKID